MNRPIHRSDLSLALLAILTLAVLATACAPDSRVSARSGMIATDEPYGKTNFTVDLPAGWTTAEYLPTGFMEGTWGAVYYQGVPFITWVIGNPELALDDRFLEVQDADTHESWSDEVAGVTGEFVRIKDEGQLTRFGVAASFESVPGAPDDARVPLFAWSPSHNCEERGVSTDDVLAIIKSVRSAKLPDDRRPFFESARVTEPSVASQELQPESETTDFTATIPDGWTYTKGLSDTGASGVLRGDGIDLWFEFSSAGGTLGRDPYSSIMNPDEFPEHDFWEEMIGGEAFYFYAPAGGASGEEACVGAHVPKLPGSPYEPRSNGRWSLGIYACDLTPDQQNLVVAIVRTFRWTGEEG